MTLIEEITAELQEYNQYFKHKILVYSYLQPIQPKEYLVEYRFIECVIIDWTDTEYIFNCRNIVTGEVCYSYNITQAEMRALKYGMEVSKSHNTEWYSIL